MENNDVEEFLKKRFPNVHIDRRYPLSTDEIDWEDIFNAMNEWKANQGDKKKVLVDANKVAEILRDNIYFSPQGDQWLVHGAIEKLINLFKEWHNELSLPTEPNVEKAAEEMIRELLYIGFASAAGAFRLYPDNKHTFADNSDYLINQGKKIFAKWASERGVANQGVKLEASAIEWLNKIQPDFDHSETYQHGFNDAIEVVKNKLLYHFEEIESLKKEIAEWAKENEDLYRKLKDQEQELELYKKKVEFYRQVTERVRTFISGRKDIGEPGQPLFDAIYDKFIQQEKANELFAFNLIEAKQERERLKGLIEGLFFQHLFNTTPKEKHQKLWDEYKRNKNL